MFRNRHHAETGRKEILWLRLRLQKVIFLSGPCPNFMAGTVISFQAFR